MKRALVLAIFLLLLACQKVDLHHGLTEIETDELLNVLHENNIVATKEKEVSGQEVSWKVSVPSGDIARARQILIANNLPRKRELGLSGVYKEKGLIPTPDEQTARFLLALKGEIINSLLKVPGVVDADVVLNVPAADEFADLSAGEKRPTASVVVRIRSGEEGSQVTEGKVQRFVANAVPNLNPNDVTVIVTRTGKVTDLSNQFYPASSPSAEEAHPLVQMAGVRLDPGSVGRFKAYFIGLLSLLVLVAAVLLVNIVRLNRLKVRLQAGTPVDAVPIEGGRRPLLEGGGGGVEGTFDVGKRERT